MRAVMVIIIYVALFKWMSCRYETGESGTVSLKK